MSFGLFIAAAVLAAVALIDSHGKSLLGWAVALLAFGLLYPRF